MTLVGWIVLIVGALAVGAVAQWVMEVDMPFRWVGTAIGAGVGAFAASEWLYAGATPEFEGMAVWPAIVGGLVIGAVVDLIAQAYAHRHVPGGQGHGAPVH